MDGRGRGLYIVVLQGPVSHRANADGFNRSLAPSRRDRLLSQIVRFGNFPSLAFSNSLGSQKK
jgi:hypothetical protein